VSDIAPDAAPATTATDASEHSPFPSDERYSLGQLLAYFFYLGVAGFGGPIALVGAMRRDLVERRGWISAEDYAEGLALAQLAPGPLAAQLAIYIGWVRGRVLGASLVGVTFILPSFVMVLVLSAFYLRYGGLSWMQGAFYGIGAAVIAVIGRSAYKLVGKTLGADRVLWFIFGLNAAITAATEREILWVFLLSGVVAMLIKAPPRSRRRSMPLGIVSLPAWTLAGLQGPATFGTLGTIFVYFAGAGSLVFGSGLAIVPFLHGGVVEQFHWLDEHQFLDAVAVAMITPGPVVITVAFIGYMVAGPLGATAAALGVFLPCYLFTVIPAPHFRKIAQNRPIRAFVDGVTSAATGAIAGAAWVLGRRAIVDWTTGLIALATLAVLIWGRKVPEPLVILAAGAAGFLLRS
jgi:chromate transporter